jgi:hypothetical protein|tara:strand:+ start:2541 stop:2879 length:339 start_codon:yes stop_codon:yes gene_type:complete
MKIKEVLSEKELREIQKFLNNPAQMGAVKKVLLANLYTNGTIQPDKNPEPMYNFALSLVAGMDGKQVKTNEEIGRDLRAAHEGILLVEGGFRDLEKLRVIPTKEKDKKNKAR